MGPRSFDRGNEESAIPLQHTHSSFNGAAVFRPRKSRLYSQSSGSGRPASMGPRSFDRGNLSCPTRSAALWTCFNGAAVFRPRKSRNTMTMQSARPWLQWGRGLSTAEIMLALGECGDRGTASMGPRSFDRGNSIPRKPLPAFSLGITFRAVAVQVPRRLPSKLGQCHKVLQRTTLRLRAVTGFFSPRDRSKARGTKKWAGIGHWCGRVAPFCGFAHAGSRSTRFIGWLAAGVHRHVRGSGYSRIKEHTFYRLVGGPSRSILRICSCGVVKWGCLLFARCSPPLP